MRSKKRDKMKTKGAVTAPFFVWFYIKILRLGWHLLRMTDLEGWGKDSILRLLSG